MRDTKPGGVLDAGTGTRHQPPSSSSFSRQDGAAQLHCRLIQHFQVTSRTWRVISSGAVGSKFGAAKTFGTFGKTVGLKFPILGAVGMRPGRQKDFTNRQINIKCQRIVSIQKSSKLKSLTSYPKWTKPWHSLRRNQQEQCVVGLNDGAVVAREDALIFDRPDVANGRSAHDIYLR